MDNMIKWSNLILPVSKQIKSWQRVNRKRKWGIHKKKFTCIGAPPELTDKDVNDEFIGVILSYGFSDDGTENSNPFLSGILAWDHAVKHWLVKTWQCEHITIGKTGHFRMRPEAPPRPKGFYFTKFKPGDAFISKTVSDFLRQLYQGDTGMGPEGIQMLTITHYKLPHLMNTKQISFMSFPDFDVAPSPMDMMIFLM